MLLFFPPLFPPSGPRVAPPTRKYQTRNFWSFNRLDFLQCHLVSCTTRFDASCACSPCRPSSSVLQDCINSKKFIAGHFVKNRHRPSDPSSIPRHSSLFFGQKKGAGRDRSSYPIPQLIILFELTPSPGKNKKHQPVYQPWQSISWALTSVFSFYNIAEQ